MTIHEGNKDKDAFRGYPGGEHAEAIWQDRWHFCPGPSEQTPNQEQSYVTGLAVFTDDQFKVPSKHIGTWGSGNLDLDDYGIIRLRFQCKTKSGKR